MKALILKYITNTISPKELETLLVWLQKPKNRKVFKTYVKNNIMLNQAYNQVDVEKAYSKVWNSLQKPKTKVVTFYWRYAAAAIIVGILATAYFFKDNLFNRPVEIQTLVIVNDNIKSGTDKATLTLGDGSEVVLEKGTNYQTKNATSNGEEIVYKTAEKQEKEIAYNTLTIQRGSQFMMTLADGTKVWLNSESQLKYPVSFIDGVDRKVELIYGEAYFEVSSSTFHKGSKFKVLNKSQEIEVLGTKFNIKAYKDETNIYTTLVEGKVSVHSSELPEHILRPGQQVDFDISKNVMSVREVDVFNEVSWKDGVFVFNKLPLEDIMKVLSRWYDIDIKFERPELKKVGFNGMIGKEQNIEVILKIIQSYGIIKDYKINNKTITLE